jgi:hypothetical protein
MSIINDTLPQTAFYVPIIKINWNMKYEFVEFYRGLGKRKMKSCFGN